MPRGRIFTASRREAFGVVKYIRLALIVFVAILGLMVATFWVFKPRIVGFRFGQPARLVVHYVDTTYELEGKAAEPGTKLLLVGVRISSVGEVPYAITPDRFELETSNNLKRQALPESPLFREKGLSFKLESGQEVEGELGFEVPEEAEGRHLQFPVR